MVLTEGDCDRLLELAEWLHSKKQSRTAEESVLLKRLVMMNKSHEEVQRCYLSQRTLKIWLKF
jgi:hypothetical protein